MTKQQKYEQVLRDIPIIDHQQQLRAVLDIDSITRNCFDDIDVATLQELAALVGGKYM